jgi:hypothetical protein
MPLIKEFLKCFGMLVVLVKRILKTEFFAKQALMHRALLAGL